MQQLSGRLFSVNSRWFFVRLFEFVFQKQFSYKTTPLVFWGTPSSFTRATPSSFSRSTPLSFFRPPPSTFLFFSFFSLEFPLLLLFQLSQFSTIIPFTDSIPQRRRISVIVVIVEDAFPEGRAHAYIFQTFVKIPTFVPRLSAEHSRAMKLCSYCCVLCPNFIVIRRGNRTLDLFCEPAVVERIKRNLPRSKASLCESTNQHQRSRFAVLETIKELIVVSYFWVTVFLYLDRSSTFETAFKRLNLSQFIQQTSCIIASLDPQGWENLPKLWVERWKDDFIHVECDRCSKIMCPARGQSRDSKIPAACRLRSNWILHSTRKRKDFNFQTLTLNIHVWLDEKRPGKRSWEGLLSLENPHP